MAGYTMVSAGRCVALGYGTLALFVAYIVFDIWCARSTDALAWNITGTWSSTEENAAGPAAENSEDAQPAQVQLEPAAAPAEEEPGEPLLFALRCLVCFWLVTTERFSDVVLRFASCMPFSFCENLIQFAAPPALIYALLWCDHLDHRSMVETAVLPMMAWSVHRQIVDFFWTLKLSDADSRGPSLTEADVDMRGPVKDKWCLLTIRSTVLFSAVLRCLGFLWLVPGSVERHALELTVAALYVLPFGGFLLLRSWGAGYLHSQGLLSLLPLFVSPLVHLYVSPPAAWDLAVALLWTPSWGLFLVLLSQLGLMYSFVAKLSQALGDDAVLTGLPVECLQGQAALLLAEIGPAEARRYAAGVLPFAAAGFIVCVWLPLCLVTPQPGCVLYALLALSVVPSMILFFLTAWTSSTARAPPPCHHVLMPTMADDKTRTDCRAEVDAAQVHSLPFLMYLLYAHPVMRIPLAFLLPVAGWFGNCFAASLQSEDECRDLRAERDAEEVYCASVCEELELEQEKCVGLQERLSNATERCRRLQKAERRLQDQANASRSGGQAHVMSAANMAAAAAAEAAMAEAAAARREVTEANASASAFASAAIEAAAREKHRFAELKREAEVARGVSKAAVEEAAVLRKRGDEMERRRDEIDLRLSTDDAARRREALALQASVDELGARVEHHRTAASTLRTRNTELKAQLKEQRRLADSAVAAAAAMQEAETQGDAALAAELAAMPPPASQHSSSSRGQLECSICLHDLRGASAQERLALPCAHVFHAACVEPWLRIHSECPECKTPVR